MVGEVDELGAGLRLVVGVGASAGGLEAFKMLLSVLPSDAGMAYLLVQHLDPTQESLLPELLAPHTEMPVVPADDGLLLRPDTVYVIRPDSALGIREGRTRLSAPSLQRGVRLPVDHLFRSLAKECGPRAVGIVLSGAGSDGSAGLREIKAAGGLTVAQTPESSGQPGMPQSAIDTGIVDATLKIQDIPAVLARFANIPPRARFEPEGELGTDPPEQLMSLTEDHLAHLAALLEEAVGFDVRAYKAATLERRVLRRAALSGFREVAAYFQYLRSTPTEQQMLVSDLLISVTDFFRDPEAFRGLRELVIEPLVVKAASGAALRVWVPGCATGEEAYSLGMEFLDAIDAQKKPVKLQIFATDADADALAFARAAVYSPSVVQRVSAQHLEKYFGPLDGKGYRVLPRLRDRVSFAVHDLTKHPAFPRMNLVSCRNVLIYLTAEAQARVLKLFHLALEPGGHLFLSTSESTGAVRELFAPLSKAHRIYSRTGSSPTVSGLTSSSARPPAMPRNANFPRPASSSLRHRQPPATDALRQAVLDAWAPPKLIVSGEGSVLFMHGELGPYLRFPQGENPRLELAALLRPEIATRARRALYECRKREEAVCAFASPDPSSLMRVRISAKPAPEVGGEAVILSFEGIGAVEQTQTEQPESSTREAALDALERELFATREDLHAAVDELESANEQLRTSNQQSMNMNEELQSANEELEATTEELRSLNEELSAVNAQLREKVDQLEKANDDLNNFLSSTKVATVFLDERLSIKRFTPAARDLLGIDNQDTGRPVTCIARDLLQHDLEAEAKGVLDDFVVRSRDVPSRGRIITRHVLPYRTESRRVEGVVVTFTDITELRTANLDLAAQTRRLELAWEAARGGIYEHRVPPDASTYCSEQWAQMLGYRRDELPGHEDLLTWLHEQIHPEDRDLVANTYAGFVSGRSERYQVEARLRNRSGRWSWVRAISKVLEKDSDGRVLRVLGMMIDITDLKRAEQALRESEGRFREMADGLPQIVWVHTASGQQELVNETFCKFYGVHREEVTGDQWKRLLHPDDAEAYGQELLQCIQERRPFHGEARARRADGAWRWIESWGQPRQGPDGELRGFVGTSTDVTERRQMEAAIRDSEERFRTLADNIAQLAWMAHGDGWIFWYNKRWHDFTGTTFEQMQGAGWERVLHPDHAERVTTKVRACFATGEIWEDTFPLRGADGSYRWYLSRALPIRDESGKVIRWFGTNTDVTEERNIEQRLLEADRQKDEFLAMLGHELRNPLAAIRSASELIKLSASESDRIARSSAVLDRQTAHMSKLIDGLLDVSRIIRGKIELEPVVLDLCSVCRETIADIFERQPSPNLTVQAALPKGPIWVRADPVRMTQIVDNLVSNAIKYTPGGGVVTVSVHQEGELVTLEVQDTGVGIPPELLPHVFDVFQQSKQSLARSKGGLGLGLALVRSLTELHGGHVEAKSPGEGGGATFLVRLPAVEETASPNSRRGNRGSEDERMRILVIEDNEDAADMLRELLELTGHDVAVAHRGQQGVQLSKEYKPDVVLCDIGLPGGMTGYDVATQLRADAETRDLRLVAVSGYGRTEDQQRAKSAGFDDHLTKPIDIRELQRLLAAPGPSSTH